MSATLNPVGRHGMSGHPSYEAATDDHPGDRPRDAPPFAAHAGPRGRVGASGVRFRRVGSGPPLLLIHPIGGDRQFWDAILPRFSHLRDVIVPDLPGHGESPRLPSADPPTPKRLAASLAALLDELGIDRVHVGGISLGAWVGLELASMGRALSVAAMCPSGLSHDVRRLPFASTLREMKRFRFSSWDEIDVPVTLAWGEHDVQIQPIAPPRPWIRWDVLAGCGHAVPVWDNPEEVERVLLRTSDAWSAGREEESMARDWIAEYRGEHSGAGDAALCD